MQDLHTYGGVYLPVMKYLLKRDCYMGLPYSNRPNIAQNLATVPDLEF